MNIPSEAAARAARIDAEARDWLLRLRDDGARHRDAFEAWYIADPDHADAYDRLLTTWDVSGQVRHTNPGGIAQGRPKRGWRTAIAAIAAIMLAAIGISLVSLAGLGRSAASAFSIETRIGEIRTDRLSDGTRVTLDTNSRLDAVFTPSRRELRLVRGRARIAVAPDPARPLRLEIATATVSDGQVVDLVRRDRDAIIAMIDGRGAVRSNGGAVPLAAGQAMTVADTGQVAAPAPVRDADARWPSGMLSFDNAPLADVIAAANRYSATPIVINGADVAALRFTGTFRAGDQTGLVRMLAAAFTLSVSKRGDRSIALSAAPTGK